MEAAWAPRLKKPLKPAADQRQLWFRPRGGARGGAGYAGPPPHSAPSSPGAHSRPAGVFALWGLFV